MNYKIANIDDVECEIASASWEMPISSTLLVTLYKVWMHVFHLQIVKSFQH